jgi:hypothetical protein
MRAMYKVDLSKKKYKKNILKNILKNIYIIFKKTIPRVQRNYIVPTVQPCMVVASLNFRAAQV